MRHIDLNRLEFPLGWSDEAKRALDNLQLVMEKIKSGDKSIKPSVEIEKYAATTWRVLKPYLSKILEDELPSSENHPDGKCWYCESRYRLRMLEVDHYRPKASVRGDEDCKDHLGYWWLAFDYKNFRLSCQTCNRLEIGDDNITRGKGTWFPLADENKRAYDVTEIENELSLLLDPTNTHDPDLLTFLADGSVEPIDSDESTLKHQRAKRSIDIYHLNACRDKRLAVCREIENLITEADTCYRLSIDARIPTEIQTEQSNLFQKKLAKLVDYLDLKSVYSMAAIAEAKRQAKEFDWVEEIIE